MSNLAVALSKPIGLISQQLLSIVNTLPRRLPSSDGVHSPPKAWIA